MTSAAEPDAAVAKIPEPVKFDLERLAVVPKTSPAEGINAEGVQSFFYEGATYHGQPTKVFAWFGMPPADPAQPNRKVPAMVLIHGGGGTAFDRWVKVWTARGYAAIAMDLCGCVPVGTYGNWKRSEVGGPPGWDASFQQLNEAPTDQWTHQAVSNVLLAHSWLRAQPNIDADKIGVTGISWGGYLTCIVAGVDQRFQFAVPVYGCGFLGENSAWLPAYEKMGPEKAGLWLNQWDPSVYLPQVKMPMLWVNGTNDFAYPMDSWQKSYRLTKEPRTLCLRIAMPHGHGPAGENPAEIHYYANQFLKAGTPLIQIVKQGETAAEAWANFESSQSIKSAQLAFTRDTGRWQERKWESAPAEIDLAQKRVSAKIPEGVTVFYLNLFDDRDCAVSTEHVVRGK